MKKILFIILILIFFINLWFHIFQYKDNYLSKFDPKYWREHYQKSQWVDKPKCILTDPHTNPKTCTWDDAYYEKNKNKKFVPYKEDAIGDDGLYTYAGWEYIHGKDPSLLNAEIPPFGKYLIGISELIFDNQNIFALINGLLVLISLFILCKIIFKDNLLSLIPVFLLSSDSLFYNQLKAPYLDTLYLGLLILIFIFVIKQKFLFANIFLGLMMATKASAPTFFITSLVSICYLFYMKDRHVIRKFLLFLPVSIFTFLLTYANYFLLGHNLRQFLGLQKWILTFYEGGAKGIPQSVWQMLLSGKWPTWWGTVENVGEWSILWTISFFAVIYYLYKVIPKRRQYKSVLFAFWIIAYLIFLTFVPVWPRYLLVILPFMYILLVWTLTKILPKLPLNTSSYYRRLRN